MHVHTYEKIWLGLSFVLIILLIGTVTYGAVGPGIAMVSDEGGTIDPNALSENERFGEPRVEQVGENEYEAYIVAQSFIFMPDPIVVPANSDVTLYITSRDVIHGFNVVGTNANTMVIPGEIATLTIRTESPGEYGIVCNEYCGVGHQDMEGKLVVVPQDEFPRNGDGSQ